MGNDRVNGIPGGSNAVDVQPDSSCGFTDHCATFQGIVNSIDRIVLHADEEAGTELRIRGTSIEKSGRSMGEVSFRHKVVSLNDPVDVPAMYSYSDTHNHVLWTLGNTSVEAKEVRALKGLESEAIRGI